MNEQNAKQEHNPDGLTPEQYGAPEWRLLRHGEKVTNGDQFFDKHEREPWNTPSNSVGYEVQFRLRTYRRRITPASTPADAPTEAGELTIRDCIMRRFAGNGTRVGMALAKLQVNEMSRADALQIIREEAERMERENFPEMDRTIATLRAECEGLRGLLEALKTLPDGEITFANGSHANGCTTLRIRRGSYLGGATFDLDGKVEPEPLPLRDIETAISAAASRGTEGQG